MAVLGKTSITELNILNPLSIENGGTGATTADGALTNLGVKTYVKSLSASGTTITYTLGNGTSKTLPTVQGTQGSQGSQGINGISSSVKGKTGTQGGANSIKGATGNTGTQGGANSVQGLKGAQGKQGTANSVKGATGNTGSNGKKGIPGIKGKQGAKGTSITSYIYNNRTGTNTVFGSTTSNRCFETNFIDFNNTSITEITLNIENEKGFLLSFYSTRKVTFRSDLPNSVIHSLDYWACKGAVTFYVHRIDHAGVPHILVTPLTTNQNFGTDISYPLQ